MSVSMGGSGRFEALQYRPGATLMHRLDARTKVLATILAIVGVVAAPHLLGYAALLVLLVVATAAGRINPELFWRAFGILFIVLIVGAVVTGLLIPGKTAVHLGPLRLTEPGINLAVRGGLSALVFLYTGALLTMTTAPTVLGAGLLWFMNPLRRLRVPVDEIAVMVSLGLAFLPLLQQELGRILLAQRARGADLRRGPLESRMAAALTLLPPLLAGNLRRAEELAVAMEARGYVPGAPRTSLNGEKFGAADALAIALVIIAVIVAARL